MARVQPGVINADLKRAVAAHGLFYPPDPACSSCPASAATWRPTPAACAACKLRRHPRLRDGPGGGAGLGRGAAHRPPHDQEHDRARPDRPVRGGRGPLGIITEVTLKLVPTPPPPATAVAYFDTLAPAGTAIAEIFRHGHEPSMMEIIDRACIRRVEQHYHMELDTDAACLLLIQSPATHRSRGHRRHGRPVRPARRQLRVRRGRPGRRRPAGGGSAPGRDGHGPHRPDVAAGGRGRAPPATGRAAGRHRGHRPATRHRDPDHRPRRRRQHAPPDRVRRRQPRRRWPPPARPSPTSSTSALRWAARSPPSTASGCSSGTSSTGSSTRSRWRAAPAQGHPGSRRPVQSRQGALTRWSHPLEQTPCVS